MTYVFVSNDTCDISGCLGRCDVANETRSAELTIYCVQRRGQDRVGAFAARIRHQRNVLVVCNDLANVVRNENIGHDIDDSADIERAIVELKPSHTLDYLERSGIGLPQAASTVVQWT